MTSESYPVVYGTTSNMKMTSFTTRLQNAIDDVISFSGIYKNYCVCIVDAVDSTKITASLPKIKTCKYYGIFLNSMAMIAKEFGASIVKNIGDSLLYYFPHTFDVSRTDPFGDVLECGMEMIKLRSVINEKMFDAGLPPISYRISADYGSIMTAKSENSSINDIFGSPVNICAKINSLAKPNGMVIGSDLYQIVKSFPGYHFQSITSYSAGLKLQYPVYCITSIPS
ncbi:MAG TPA: adenylate/guanylate cyclase domain-containing protein [Nitrosopumilaceae archaeon]|nr:adenylate/guanylate cyclase domain-containing protein [Nitrosopumilaceae archaeon]